jgi:hypothetical protein
MVFNGLDERVGEISVGHMCTMGDLPICPVAAYIPSEETVMQVMSSVCASKYSWRLSARL